MIESHFASGIDSLDLSSCLDVPDSADCVVVLAHGAGANMNHQHMTQLAGALESQRIATFRYNFPFMEQGKRRVDNIATCLAVIKRAIDICLASVDLPLVLGGHSFGGRMSTHYAADDDPRIKALALYSFPLHVAGKPDIKRANHLPEIHVPVLFVSGDRDALADIDLMKKVTAPLSNTAIHWLHTADHSYKIQKRTRKSTEDVYEEAARVTREFVDAHVINK